jgi:hypothetical protein
MEEDTRDYCVPREVLALLSDERLILRETGRAVTPFGGVAVFVAYLRKGWLRGEASAIHADLLAIAESD